MKSVLQQNIDNIVKYAQDVLDKSRVVMEESISVMTAHKNAVRLLKVLYKP